MPLPTFVVAGAQKSGTTTLHRLLESHPQIYMAKPKELHFFDRKWRKGTDWYARRFTPNPEQVQIGESTPIYMYDAETRARMCRTLPDLQVVVILREPIGRAYSHYWHSRSLGVEDLDTFEEAIEQEPQRLATEDLRQRSYYSYIDRGHYIDQLTALERAYGRSRMHVVLLDDLNADSERTLRDLFAFLGVRTGPARRLPPRRVNVYRETPKPGTGGPAARPVPASYPPMAPETRAELLAHYRPYNDQLAKWLGRDLDEWNTVSSRVGAG